ncbi:23S rRNA pseudouridine(955/2504/2580) synthase RluC [Methylocaldum sp.]|uniref:23S rRNA pseudouridine(955/2504/2580) synthase RluC n=1 Tax=Methylocaldum sp. TaxID=1969727 RepID=UPI002D4B9969|nr:23S rRNA pseudouridine(955/2504/2580) synthase RluC [Methylocaldum sp.]HYE34552.1 23S rRNA pseudouridine(955/2504/2580) synthase RluC [Methylocaldum sp.]
MKEASSGVSVQWIEIDEESAGQRIDNFLFARLKGVPKSHVYRILRTGEVRRNGGRIQARERLDTGDLIRIPPIRLASRDHDGVPEAFVRARLEPRVLYEDDDLLVLNKPAGMAVHGGSGLSFGVIEGLREIRPEARFLELVHRLDRDTSGCLLIAKKRSALRILHEQFRNDEVKKVYLALLAGPWARTRWIMDAPLKKNVLQSGERMVRVAREGKPAVTEFRRKDRYANSTLVEARPVTGRTHQIRVHAQAMGHPIVGDERYGDEKINREFRQLGLKRLFLHALETAFRHPRTGKSTEAKAPLDQDLSEFLDILSR